MSDDTPDAAWHPDPFGRHELRYWDGSEWTEHVSDGGVAATDPPVATPVETPPAAVTYLHRSRISRLGL